MVGERPPQWFDSGCPFCKSAFILIENGCENLRGSCDPVGQYRSPESSHKRVQSSPTSTLFSVWFIDRALRLVLVTIAGTMSLARQVSANTRPV